MRLASDIRGDGFPLICLPWFGLDATVMAAAMEPALAGQAIRRIYVDLPGCGRSPGGPADSDAVLAAVCEFIDHVVGNDRFLLAGCSYGGYLAAGLARRRPDQVDGLLLICPGVKIRREDRDLPTGPEESADAVWLAEAPADLRDHLAQALGNRTRQVARRVGAVLARSEPGDEAYLRRLWETGYRLSDEDSTAGYNGPVSIVAGRLDRIAGYADQFRALANYPNGSYTVLAHAGHYLPFEQPSAFRGVVLDWLSRTSAPHPAAGRSGATPLTVGADVTVRLLKGDHRDVRYPMTVLHDDGTHIVVRGPWAGPETRDFGFVRFEDGDIFTEHYWRDRWYSIKEVRAADGRLKGWYCDVTRPAEIVRTDAESGAENASLVVEDLYLDLWLSADRATTLRLDEDEFAASGIDHRDPGTAAAARHALDELERLAADAFAPLLDVP